MHRLDKIYAKKGVTLREMWVLFSVYRHPYSQRELSNLMGMNENVMVTLIDCIEQKGLVLRQRNPENRREYKLVLTSKGMKLTKWAMDHYDELATKAWSPLTMEELEQLRGVLVRFVVASSPGASVPQP